MALGAPEDALRPLLRQQVLTGRQLEAEERYLEAAAHYRMVVKAEPSYTQAVLDLGRVLERADAPRDALEAYGRAPHDADVVEAMGRLQLALGDRRGAASTFDKLRSLRPSDPSWRLLMADTVGEESPEVAVALLLEYLEFHNTSVQDHGLLEVALRVATILRQQERAEGAVGLLERLLDRTPEGTQGRAHLEALMVQFDIDRTALQLARASTQDLSDAGAERLRTAREAFADGDVARASEVLEALVIDEPQAAVAWAAVSDVRAAQGDVAAAEQAIRAAHQLAPLEPGYLARHGDLLSAYGGRYDVDAANAYAAAVRRGATDPELWVRKARAERRAGRFERSVESYRQALSLDPEASWADEARAVLAGAERVRPADQVLPQRAERPSSVPPGAWMAFHRAWAWREEGDPDQALEQVRLALSEAPRFVRAINLEAQLLADLGRTEEARTLLWQSLELDEAQPRVLAILAGLEERSGAVDAAAGLWERAAKLGDPDALWRQARRQAAEGRWWAARATLATYFGRTTSASSYDEARALDQRLAGRIRTAVAFMVISSASLVLLPVWVRVRQQAGVDLQGLLDQSPRAWREVARIASAIRHEVLKHHTSVLDAVAEALEAGEPAVELGDWAADRLFGPGGALEQLDGYVIELEHVAEQAGVSLNLRVRDPVFRPLLAAVERLRGLESDLRRGEGTRLAQRLRDVSTALNGQAYQQLGQLISGLSVQRVDTALLEGFWSQVTAEPAFRGRVLPELVLEPVAEDVSVRMSLADLRDVVVNLLRNVVQACVDARAGRIGLAVGVEEDEITGLEEVVLRVRDTLSGRLTTQMIEAREISRGLGLVADLVKHAGGSVHVEPDPGWRKAVVVRIPRAEEEPWT
ncbi:MAG: tetratricopeptide repeat protein [Myxococcales bacterium]|nr:tetratricopeptide repeat protein [Myxococcales bacterium]